MNKNFEGGKQVGPSHDALKSQDRKGKQVSDKKPAFKQTPHNPIGMPAMKDSGFKSKTKMADVIS